MKFHAYKYSVDELIWANKARELGLIMTKDYQQEIYLIYDDPELLGAFTYKNELLWTRYLPVVQQYLEKYEQEA